MDIAVPHAKFQTKNLTIRPAKWLSAKLLQKGEPVEGKRGKFEVRDDQGQLHTVKLTSIFIDPIPKVSIDEEDIGIVEPIAWYEYTWAGLPIVLVFIGGALGAVCGMMAMYSNTRIFRSDRGAVTKYFLSGAISFGYTLLFIVLATVVQVFLGQM